MSQKHDGVQSCPMLSEDQLQVSCEMCLWGMLHADVMAATNAFSIWNVCTCDAALFIGMGWGWAGHQEGIFGESPAKYVFMTFQGMNMRDGSSNAPEAP